MQTNCSYLLFRLLKYIKIKLFSVELQFTIPDNGKISALIRNVFYKNVRIYLQYLYDNLQYTVWINFFTIEGKY